MTTHEAGVLDTSIIAALRRYDPAVLPSALLITAVTLGELSCGPHATDDPLNPQLADQYGIVMSTSHEEPMMRAEKEWHAATDGPWDYSTNAQVATFSFQ